MYHPKNLRITSIDAVSVWVTGVFSENPSQLYPVERRTPIDHIPIHEGEQTYHNSRIWADIGQLLTTA